MKKGKWLFEEDLQITEKTREAKGKGENERYIHLNAEFQRIARRDEKAILSDQCKEIEENNRMGKTRNHFKKIRYQGTISGKDGHHKGQKWQGLKRSRRDKEVVARIHRTGQKKTLITWITMMVWPFTWSQTSWSVSSSGP